MYFFMRQMKSFAVLFFLEKFKIPLKLTKSTYLKKFPNAKFHAEFRNAMLGKQLLTTTSEIHASQHIIKGYDYTAYMDYMDPMSSVPKKADKFNLSTLSQHIIKTK